jgi:hypothetical protein
MAVCGLHIAYNKKFSYPLITETISLSAHYYAKVSLMLTITSLYRPTNTTVYYYSLNSLTLMSK